MKAIIANYGKSFLRWGPIGAFLFWLPDILIHAFRRNNFDGKDAWIVTIACPLFLVTGYFLLGHYSKERFSTRHAASFLLAVWVFGGLAIMIASSFGGGGFVSGAGVALGLSFAGILPPVTFILSTYDGSLFALIGGTAFLCAEMGAQLVRFAQQRQTQAAS